MSTEEEEDGGGGGGETDEENYEEDDRCALDVIRSLPSTDDAADSGVEGASALSFLGRWARTLAGKHRSKYFDGSPPSSRSAIQHLTTSRCDWESDNMAALEELSPLHAPEGGAGARGGEGGTSNGGGLVGRQKEVELGEVERRRGGDRWGNRNQSDGSDQAAIIDEMTTKNPLHSAVVAMTGTGDFDGYAPATGHMVDMDELAFLTASSGTLL